MAKAAAKSTKPKRANNPNNPKRRRGRRRFTVPMALAISIGFSLRNSWSDYKRLDSATFWNVTMAHYTGYNASAGKWDWGYTRWGIRPILYGYLIHWVASAVGVNRALARARIPIFRI